MKMGDLVKIKTGYSYNDGRVGVVIFEWVNGYYGVIVAEMGMHFYRDDHVEILNETR